jgi:hypothetical protein
MGVNRDEKRRRNVGLLAQITERDVRVMAQLKRAGVISLELGELRVSFDAYDGEIEIDGDTTSVASVASSGHVGGVGDLPIRPHVDGDDCENDHSGFEVVTGRPGDDEIN